jgi:arginyl-tRNA--protein-N-Asp/Glu arginylyltransferase
MGGEFFCNPDWFEILDMFLAIDCDIRLVSNGDWGENSEVKSKLKELFNRYNRNFHISLSKDDYHTNQFVDEAASFLDETGMKYNVGETSEHGDNGLVPIGRSEYSCGFYGIFGCYCTNPTHMYSFLIDEDGNIFKCSFGSWQYANIKDYKDGGFAKRFKEFNKTFYKCFISSCTACINAAKQDGALVNND